MKRRITANEMAQEFVMPHARVLISGGAETSALALAHLRVGAELLVEVDEQLAAEVSEAITAALAKLLERHGQGQQQRPAA